jgi:hypothetical protein
MKTKSKSPVTSRLPSDEEIRDYAQHLYEQSGRQPGHDLDNWLEAKACLEANIPKQHAHARLHRHRHPEEFEFAVVALETETTPSGLLLMTPGR